MSGFADSISEAVEWLTYSVLDLKVIGLDGQTHTEAELVELIDCLMAHPDGIKYLWMRYNRLTDETGVKLARYVAASSTIKSLELESNQLGEATYLALAAALRVNSSLRILNLYDNQPVDRTRVDAAFIDALRLNPIRPAKPHWQLYEDDMFDLDFKRLKPTADGLGHPTLQMILNHELEKKEIE